MHDIIQGNCLEVLTQLEDNSIDSIVTDPPYELGFMGKAWDNTGIANNKEMWSECLRVLKPGGHLLAFSGTRTYHRMASAIEDAGFEVRDMIEWVYGSGFPKSLNIGKAVDKLQGNEREELGDMKPAGFKTAASGYTDTKAWSGKVSKGTSEWEGWGTALKPAHEPICFARKPLEKGLTIAENCLKYGTGGINIDESRVEPTGDVSGWSQTGSKAGENRAMSGANYEREPKPDNQNGRFLANLIHDNSEEVRECFPETKTGAVKTTIDNGANQPINLGGGLTKERLADSGNASRFFKSIIYQSKASKRDRGEGNIHPTVKSVALMEYLIKMVTPKGGIVLDPFAGSGSTLVAAKQNGFQYIGIELDKDYCIIAKSRLKQKILKQEVLF